MSMNRREIILSAAAGGLLAGAGLSPVPAAAEAKEPFSLAEWQAITKAAGMPGVPAWVQDIRSGFERRGIPAEMAHRLTRMNLLMITTAPELLPARDRLKLDSGDAAYTEIRAEHYDLTWSFEPAKGSGAMKAGMESVLIQTAALQAIEEVRARTESLRQQGLRMRPITPIHSLGVRADQTTFQPVMGFGRLFAVAPMEAEALTG
jgi:hypothetical protein